MSFFLISFSPWPLSFVRYVLRNKVSALYHDTSGEILEDYHVLRMVYRALNPSLLVAGW